MSKDVNSKLLNQMAYGSISCRDVPGDIEDYNVSLIKQYHKNSPPALKLKFTPKRYQQNLEDFYVKIDDVRSPANPLILIKYVQNQGKITAKARNKIQNKMILSVERQIKQRQQVVQSDQDSFDSDIPRGESIYERLNPNFKRQQNANYDSDNEGTGKKRTKNWAQQADESN